MPVALAVTHPPSRDISSSNSPSVDLNLLSRFTKQRLTGRHVSSVACSRVRHRSNKVTPPNPSTHTHTHKKEKPNPNIHRGRQLSPWQRSFFTWAPAAIQTRRKPVKLPLLKLCHQLGWSSLPKMQKKKNPTHHQGGQENKKSKGLTPWD